MVSPVVVPSLILSRTHLQNAISWSVRPASVDDIQWLFERTRKTLKTLAKTKTAARGAPVKKQTNKQTNRETHRPQDVQVDRQHQRAVDGDEHDGVDDVDDNVGRRADALPRAAHPSC